MVLMRASHTFPAVEVLPEVLLADAICVSEFEAQDHLGCTRYVTNEMKADAGEESLSHDEIL